jgi:hypothetical protein
MRRRMGERAFQGGPKPRGAAPVSDRGFSSGARCSGFGPCLAICCRRWRRSAPPSVAPTAGPWPRRAGSRFESGRPLHRPRWSAAPSRSSSGSLIPGVGWRRRSRVHGGRPGAPERVDWQRSARTGEPIQSTGQPSASSWIASRAGWKVLGGSLRATRSSGAQRRRPVRGRCRRWKASDRRTLVPPWSMALGKWRSEAAPRCAG